MGQAVRQRFSGCGERRCAYKLRLSAAMYAQMYAQLLGSQWSQYVALGFCFLRPPDQGSATDDQQRFTHVLAFE